MEVYLSSLIKVVTDQGLKWKNFEAKETSTFKNLLFVGSRICVDFQRCMIFFYKPIDVFLRFFCKKLAETAYIGLQPAAMRGIKTELTAFLMHIA
ncbi:hypothetical protein Gasu2_44000 [Galdieria sulphuraria]|nr:hypothetical protein Gasu2_44000 [Galdieria sulphuraria]